jgi:bifunctional DNase/RNase
MITATDVGFIEMRIAKVVGVGRLAEQEFFPCVVLDEVSGDRHLPIQIGQAEAFSLTASLSSMRWGRPMTYQFTAALVRGLGGRVRQMRLDRLEAGAYAATVEVEGPLGVEVVDARASDALNLAVVVDSPIFVALEVLADCETRQQGDSAEATLLRQALMAPPMTIKREEM